MSDTNTDIILLGRRWAESAPLSDAGDWRAHYARHASFPAPARGEPVAGGGVAIVDASDFAAVQTAHSYTDGWTLLAFLPDLHGIVEDYDKRVVLEALVYGGLRDLELSIIADPGEAPSRTLFIVDTPGREPSVTELRTLAEAVVGLRDQWRSASPVGGAWPPVCRHINIWRAADEGGPSAWTRYRAPSDGSDAEHGAAIVSTTARRRTSAPSLVFRSGDDWLAIGRPETLADFVVCHNCYQSARLVLGDRPPAWPEPAVADPGPARRFLNKLAGPVRDEGPGDGDVLAVLAASNAPARPSLPPDLPLYVRRWLGRTPETDGG